MYCIFFGTKNTYYNDTFLTIYFKFNITTTINNNLLNVNNSVSYHSLNMRLILFKL